MEILSGTNIIERMASLNPTHIAVAYIGIDWKKYVDPSSIESIIISPTIGSNPEAISDIVQEKGWDIVHFLDNLHSKVYIGKYGMIVGSANLSRNALDEGGHHELCIFSSDADEMDRAKEIFNQYIEEARSAYPNEKMKVKKLTWLLENYKPNFPLPFPNENIHIPADWEKRLNIQFDNTDIINFLRNQLKLANQDRNAVCNSNREGIPSSIKYQINDMWKCRILFSRGKTKEIELFYSHNQYKSNFFSIKMNRNHARIYQIMRFENDRAYWMKHLRNDLENMRPWGNDGGLAFNVRNRESFETFYQCLENDMGNVNWDYS